MFIPATIISTTILAFWRQLLIAILVLVVCVKGVEAFAMPFHWVENTFGETSKVERSFSAVDGGWTIRVVNRTDLILRRTHVYCPIGNSNTVMADIMPGDSFSGVVGGEHPQENHNSCRITWDFVKPVGQYRQ